MSPFPTPTATKQEIMDRVSAMAPRFAERAAAAEEARRIPEESVKEMLDAGFARILVPKSVGGYGIVRIFQQTACGSPRVQWRVGNPRFD